MFNFLSLSYFHLAPIEIGLDVFNEVANIRRNPTCIYSTLLCCCTDGAYSFFSSLSISSSGRRCPDGSAKLIPVLRHTACCCHRTELRVACDRDMFAFRSCVSEQSAVRKHCPVQTT